MGRVYASSKRCDEMEVEEDAKQKTKGKMGAAKSLCTTFDQPKLPTGTRYFATGRLAKKWTNWDRSYLQFCRKI
ncbi:hypothetical protein GIB67_004976 [Kingdonia uniflora]|uniref:Proline-tRNA ligase class II C-terminal domain-containing protein n=1 Tax=Kingdonia uniflora TaxID=39325 RepID=A0A7J7NN68_9MAGN|nr:hypothetical protein GIB67_004976 [Kingdonia uniflora]